MIGIFLLLTILLFVLFCPFYIEYRTDENKITLRLFYFLTIKHKLENYNSKKNTTDSLLKWFNRKRKLNTRFLFKILQTFKLIHLNIKIDTGNYQLNGILYPLIFLMSFILKKNISINFNGTNVIHFIGKNNLARLSWAIISSKTIN
jgi:hypothetical protein